jgi:hypothetical protein
MRGIVIGFFISGCIFALQFVNGWVPSGADKARWFVFLLPYMVALFVLFGAFVWHAAWQMHKEGLDGIDLRDAIIAELVAEVPRIEIAGAFDFLAGEADKLAVSLKIMHFEAGKETDPEEYAVVSCPLDNTTLDPSNRSKWRWMHYRMWQFQGLYADHFNNVLMERMNTGFESFVTKHPLNARESTTALEASQGLESHARALRDQAAKLREDFKVSATISPTVQT